AIALMPDNASMRQNLGHALHDRGDLDEAIAQLRHAVALKPDYARAWCNLGIALIDAGQLSPSSGIEAYRKAIQLDPGFIAAHSNLVFALQFVPGVTAQDLLAEHRRWAGQFEQPLSQRAMVHVRAA